MKYLDHSFLTAAEDLACDEALLDAAEEEESGEVLRFWEPAQVFVVVGYSNSISREVHVKRCNEEQIPIFRRCSGGGAVLQCPGCLNYSLVLDAHARGLQSISQANRWIMEQQRLAVKQVAQGDIQVRGHTDLVLGERKFSGNSQRRKRRFLLFHGSFLLNADLDQIARLLAHPSKEPEYRGSRSHVEFLINLAIPSAKLKEALLLQWQASESSAPASAERIARLVQEKYRQQEWNSKFP